MTMLTVKPLLVIISFLGLVACQPQATTNKKNAPTNKPTLSAFEGKTALSEAEYKFAIAKTDNAKLDKVLTFDDAARFERRIGIGAPLKRVNRYVGKSRREVIKIVVSELEDYEDKFVWPDWVKNVTPISFFERSRKRNRFYCGEKMFEDSLRLELSKRILATKTPQFERLFLFWLDHFSVEFSAYSQSHAYAEHLKLVRNNSNGNFINMLLNVVHDPGMIVYLNNESSTVEKPNENLAREFLELFSLGEGKYSEKDIRNLAKALAPHGINFVSEKPRWYSSKASGREFKAFGLSYKTFDEFVHLISKRRDFGELVAKKFYREFVSIKSPNPNDIAILMSTFRKSGFSIPKLFEATISLESFWAEKTRLSIVKSPIELLYGTARTLGHVGEDNDHSWLSAFSSELGQDLLNPPNVAGFPGGKAWVHGQLMEKRMTLLSEKFGNFFFKGMSHNDAEPTNSMKNKSSNRAKKRAERIYGYLHRKKKFFAELKKDQLGVETILLNEVSKEFETHRWRKIEVAFYNVKLNDRKWDGITIRIGNDENDKGRYGDYVRIEQGKSSPNIFETFAVGSKWKGVLYRKFSYPFGNKMKAAPNTVEERLLVERLIQAMQTLLDYDRSYSQLSVNEPAKKWLRQFIKKVGVSNLMDEQGEYAPVKMFAIPKSGMSYQSAYAKPENFRCGFGQSPHNFFAARRVPEEFNEYKLPKNFAFEKNNAIIKLLLPDLASELGTIGPVGAIMHEGYQLR